MKTILVGEIYKDRMLLTPDDGVKKGLDANEATIGDIRRVLTPLTPEEKRTWAKDLVEFEK